MHSRTEVAKLCFVLMAAVSLPACATMKEPQVVLSCSTDDESRLVFSISKNARVLGMAYFMVWIDGSKEYLWKLSMNYGTVNSITYGEIPVGAQQTHPKDAKPRSITVGDRFYVAVHFMYDSPMAGASSGTVVHEFLREADGINNLGLVERYRMPEDVAR